MRTVRSSRSNFRRPRVHRPRRPDRRRARLRVEPLDVGLVLVQQQRPDGYGDQRHRHPRWNNDHEGEQQYSGDDVQQRHPAVPSGTATFTTPNCVIPPGSVITDVQAAGTRAAKETTTPTRRLRTTGSRARIGIRTTSRASRCSSRRDSSRPAPTATSRPRGAAPTRRCLSITGSSPDRRCAGSTTTTRRARVRPACRPSAG